MTINYESLAATVTKMLRVYGAPATITRKTVAAYDPTTASSAPTASSTSDVFAACFDLPEHMVNGTSILQGDMRAYVNAVGVAPQPGDTLTWQGMTMEVITTKDLKPAGTSLLFELIVRRQ